MGRKRRSGKDASSYHHHSKSFVIPSKGKMPFSTEQMDPVEFRAAVGDDVYNRIMQWNDSGAVEAMHAAEERRMARERKKPCWVPKLKGNLFIGEVDWDKKDSGEICEVPQSAVALAEQLLQDQQNTSLADGLHGEQGGQQSSPAALPPLIPAIVDELHHIKPSGWGEVDESYIIKPSDWGELEDLHPIEPSGWGELVGDANGPIFSASVHSATLAEAVLEDSVDGQRLLVGGQPFEPSGWDQLDPSWPQLGWDPPGLHAKAKLKSSWEISEYNNDNPYRFHQGNYLEDDSSRRQTSEIGPERDPGWKDHRWYPDQHSPFQRGCYMTAC